MLIFRVHNRSIVGDTATLAALTKTFQLEVNQTASVLSSIVVVEDDASMRQAIQRILRAAGYTAVAFVSAEAFLEAESATAVDCIILDIHLPGISGLDLYRRLALSGKQPPAIFITARDESAVREEAASLQATAYLPKPFSGQTLLNVVSQAIGSR